MAKISGAGNTEFVTLFQDEVPLTFRQYFVLLQDDGDFVVWYTGQLKGSGFSAYFWEHPPLTRTTIDSNAEFVLVNAPMLENLQPNPAPFRSYFVAGEVVTFRNLGGDATLIAPSPAEASQGYAHLATFLHRAPANQVRALWRNVGQTVRKSLTDSPIWLSTSGLGVAWLHIRLDSSPKYYQHQPYKVPPAADDR
jgi:alpha-ketoglutarate-dependent taurine dioxygenase